jgi:signal transduction histidine kinase/CheY-like chemotaxis protein
MMDATPICSMLWDKDGRIFECNEESVKLFKMKDKEEFIDRFYDLSPEYQGDGQRSRDLSKICVARAFEDGVYIFEWIHQLLDGTPIPCEMTLVRVNYGDSYIVAAYARDLRKHKQMMAETLRLHTELEAALKEAQEANRAKSRFLATMSHEMRTPLNAVIGLSELILNTETLPGEAQERLNNVYISGMTLLGIVNDILDLSKIESGKLEMHPVKYDTPSLINDIVSLNIVRIGEKPITFNLIVDEKLPGFLFGDDLRVKQIFNNLLSNAFKYTNSGTVEWSVSFEKDNVGGAAGDDSVWLVSSVKDSGLGIKSDDLQKLFRDYSQVDAQTNRKTEGTGLGLAITKRLVEMMDGTITVESEYGSGTTFSIRLRQKYVSDVPIGREMAENLMSERFFASRRTQRSNFMHVDLSYAYILIVDDVPTNLDVAKGMLKPYRICVDCASSGRQAIEMIRAENPQYDAVFMDHMMPGMDGIEATRIIREEIGTDYARNVPIIALTANAITGNEEMFLQNGFQAFISKPIDIMQLDSVLRQWVRSKEREKEFDAEESSSLPVEHNSNGNNDFASNRPPLSGMTIDGIDIGSGLKRFSGDETSYIEVLQSFAESTRPFLENMMKYLQKLNLADYKIIVHGIKSSNFGVGAVQLGRKAERLEKWAEEGETEKVMSLNGAFIEKMKKLLDSVDEALAKYGMENNIGL